MFSLLHWLPLPWVHLYQINMISTNSGTDDRDAIQVADVDVEVSRRIGWIELAVAAVAVCACGCFLFVTIDRGMQNYDNWLMGSAPGWTAVYHYWLKIAIVGTAAALAFVAGIAGILSLTRRARASQRVLRIFRVAGMILAILAALAVYLYLLPTTTAIYEAWPIWAQKRYGQPSLLVRAASWTTALVCWCGWLYLSNAHFLELTHSTTAASRDVQNKVFTNTTTAHQ